MFQEPLPDEPVAPPAPWSESERVLDPVGVCLPLAGGTPAVELVPEGPLRLVVEDEGLCCDLDHPEFSKYDPECACEWLEP